MIGNRSAYRGKDYRLVRGDRMAGGRELRGNRMAKKLCGVVMIIQN